ncbi:MAG: hypothetical protein IJ458_03860 [Clostridia bacterium]|nr:hypothetical protein [Clostridia bacterium]
MTALDLIQRSATMLNVKQILDDERLNDSTSLISEEDLLSSNFELKRMFEFVKIVVNEVASYSNELKVVTCSTQNKKIQLNLINNVLKVVAVKSGDKYVKYQIYNNDIVLDEDGVYDVVINSYPQIDGLRYNINIINREAGEDLFLCGLNAYYCLANGLFAEYNVYNSSYVDKLSRIKNLKLFAMPCRSWHD